MTIQSERSTNGLEVRKEVLGAEHVDASMAKVSDFSRAVQDWVTQACWGDVWSRPGLDRRTKSLATVAVLAAQGRPLGLELNIRMALNNGATRQDVVETLLHIAPYAGFPAAWEGLALASKVFGEQGEPERPA